MRPDVLFRALYAAGAFYRVVGDSLRFARGTLPPELREEVARQKEALLAGPCALCGAELATRGDRCRWCDAVRGRESSYEPGSFAERCYLDALEKSLLRYQHAA